MSVIHLSKYKNCIKQKNYDDSITIVVNITQSDLDGLYTLIQFFEGFESASKKQVEGFFTLKSFYRKLLSCISKS